MSTIIIKHIDTCRHGYAPVSRKELDTLGLLNKISEYSYTSKGGEVVYLEEDGDLKLYIDALQALGHDYIIKTTPTQQLYLTSRLLPFKSSNPSTSQGIVLWYDSLKGEGIVLSDSGERFYLHFSALGIKGMFYPEDQSIEIDNKRCEFRSYLDNRIKDIRLLS